MKSRYPALSLLLVSLIVNISCGFAIAADDKEPSPPEIKKTVKIVREPTPDFASKRLYVEFVDSPKLSAVIRNVLRDRGFALADSVEDSDAQIRFRGVVAVGLFATKPNTMSLADAVEKSLVKPNSKENAEVGNSSLAEVVAIDTVAKNITPSIRNVVSATNILEWLGDVTGLRAGFNKALTGDPRGFCMSEHCNKYQQQVVVGAMGAVSWLVTMSTLSETIVLDRLIAESLESALAPLVINTK